MSIMLNSIFCMRYINKGFEQSIGCLSYANTAMAQDVVVALPDRLGSEAVQPARLTRVAVNVRMCRIHII
jgi:hypothetical protein